MSLRLLSARGKSTLTEWVSTGTVIIKIISNTNITSTSGVMLISLITSLSSSSPPPKAILTYLFWSSFAGFQFSHRGRFTACRWSAGNQVGVELVRETVKFAEHTFIATIQRVVAKHCGDGYREAERRHN